MKLLINFPVSPIFDIKNKQKGIPFRSKILLAIF